MQFLNSSSIKPNFLMILILLLFGCGLPFSTQTDPNVEIIISKQEDVRGWGLSPGGDKIVYQSVSDKTVTRYLLVVETQQKHNIDDCRIPIWLDNINLLCFNSSNIIATDDFTRIPLKEIEATADLDKLLSTAGAIYRFEGEYDSGIVVDHQALFVLDSDYKNNRNNNYKVIVEDIDIVLQGYNYIPIPSRQWNSMLKGQEYSPNGAYYYYLSSSSTRGFGPPLVLYDAVTHEKLTEFEVRDPDRIQVGGWAADSSGVYFQVEQGGAIGRFDYKEPIRKLKVPE